MWLDAQMKALGHLERFDLEHLIAERLHESRAHLLAYLDEELPQAVLEQLEKDVERLARHVPLQYVLGYAWFGDAQFMVDKRVLIPRYDTEVLVETLLSRAPQTSETVCDLCTGSGIVAVSLARARNWRVCASDISEDALEIAKINIKRLAPHIILRKGDLFAPWEGERFDAVSANPPYIAAQEYASLSPEVQHEPCLLYTSDAADD